MVTESLDLVISDGISSLTREATLRSNIVTEYWGEDHPYLPFIRLSSSSKGAQGQRFVTGMLEKVGVSIGKRTRGNDYSANGLRVEHKTACETVDGKVVIEQVRPNQQWDVLSVLVMARDHVKLFFIPKTDALALFERQHGKETMWGWFDVDMLSDAWGMYGGEVQAVLKNIDSYLN
jgi:hypothetical protein